MVEQCEPINIEMTREEGFTIYTIIGLEDDPLKYKSIYLELLKKIEQNKFKFLSNGNEIPVVRAIPSLEIH